VKALLFRLTEKFRISEEGCPVLLKFKRHSSLVCPLDVISECKFIDFSVNKAIVDITRRPRCCPLVNHFEYTPYSHAPFDPLRGKLRHPQNRKYITYCSIVREGPTHCQLVHVQKISWSFDMLLMRYASE